jgi:hypothetical protein
MKYHVTKGGKDDMKKGRGKGGLYEEREGRRETQQEDYDEKCRWW